MEDSRQKRERIQMTTAGAGFFDLEGQNTSEMS
jgi:preprotein translocase subunit Sec61beta